jgi:hypothetical protein
MKLQARLLPFLLLPFGLRDVEEKTAHLFPIISVRSSIARFAKGAKRCKEKSRGTPKEPTRSVS